MIGRGGGEWVGVMSKGNSVSESGRVKEVWVCWGTEVWRGVWLGVLTGVVSKEGVIGIGFKGGCWGVGTEVCEEGIVSLETEEEGWEEESDKNTVRSRMETKGKRLQISLRRNGEERLILNVDRNRDDIGWRKI